RGPERAGHQRPRRVRHRLGPRRPHRRTGVRAVGRPVQSDTHGRHGGRRLDGDLTLLGLASQGGGPWTWVYPACYLLLALAHTGARVGRKTYVVDMAEGDRRTEYVAVANSAMGVLLLGAGAITGLLALAGPEASLALLAVLGLTGAVCAVRLPEVGARPA